MPRSRGAEVPQRQSPRGSHQVRASGSDSDPLHHRPVADRSPKIADRRSPRGAMQSGVNQKKLGTRIADLESQLGQAQEELKTLKDQLVSAEDAKRHAQAELEKKTKKSSVSVSDKGMSSPTENQEFKKTNEIKQNEAPEDFQQETEICEVHVEMVMPKVELCHPSDQHEKESEAVDTTAELLAPPDAQKLSLDDSALKDNEMKMLREKLEEIGKELSDSIGENDSLKKQLDHANSDIYSAQTREKDMASRLTELEKDLKTSNESNAQLKIKLEGVEGAKEALEAEMKMLRIQTEQWRKAANAAAAVLAGGVEMNGGFSERCSSTDKHFGRLFEPSAGGYNSLLASPGATDYSDDRYGSGKRKGSGIKMFGDIWKKKGQK